MSSFLSYRNASAEEWMTRLGTITANLTANTAVAARAGRANAKKPKLA
jgi:hypothetical protein